MLLCARSVGWVRSALIRCSGGEASPIARATARGRKGLITIIAYLLCIAVILISPYAAIAIYIAVAAMWLVPDRRFERFGE
jgi:cobalamin synthase